jgi:hypothetical protein
MTVLGLSFNWNTLYTLFITTAKAGTMPILHLGITLYVLQKRVTVTTWVAIRVGNKEQLHDIAAANRTTKELNGQGTRHAQ